MVHLMSLVFSGTVGKRIYGGKFGGQLTHAFSKHLRFEQSDLYSQHCVEHSLFVIMDDNL